MIASQVSDTDGIDAGLLSTPELSLRAGKLITTLNPTGHPPGLDVKESDMKDLLARLDTYASVTHRGSLASAGHSLHSGLASPTNCSTSNTKLAAQASASSKPVVEKASKSVKFCTSSPQGGVPKRQSAKSTQFALSTTQKLKTDQRQKDRSRDSSIERFGKFTSGTTRLATSALTKDAGETILSEKDDTISEFSDSSADSEVEMKRKRLRSEDDDSFDFPLLPDSVLVSIGDPVDPLGPNTDDSKDGENTSDGPSNSQQSSEDSQSLQYFLPKELFEIENGHESELFYEHVVPLTEDDIQYVPPPIMRTAFSNKFSCALPVVFCHL